MMSTARVLPFGLVPILMLAASAVPGQVWSSADGLWREVGAAEAAARSGTTRPRPPGARILALDADVMEAMLAAAPREFSSAARSAPQEISIPLPHGRTARFAIEESPVMHPELAARFPEIRTYLGRGIDDPAASARLDWTPRGFHAQILKPSGAVYVDPAEASRSGLYFSYAAQDYGYPDPQGWTCHVQGRGAARPAGALLSARGLTSGTTLRTYRLAVACTGEYAAFHGGTVPEALSAIVTTINRVTGIYEQELAVRLELVANNDLILYTDAGADPYSNNDAAAMLNQNTTNLNNVLGAANYDIGHVFSTGGGGLAGLGVVCGSDKARGVTGRSQPVGDPFDVDFVAHEIGHQFDGDHTFNGDSGSCTGSNRNGPTAYEPGSGSTIQAYAGICGNDNLQPRSDPYFHSESHAQMFAFIASGGGAGCAATNPTGNNPPTIDAGLDYHIPKSTPFELTATGEDFDSDTLTYCWEQRDLGPQQDVNAGDNGSSPLFRSWPPTASPSRTFPRLTDLVNNTAAVGETLPITGRVLNFRCTVRDNRSGGGGVSSDDIQITGVGLAGPFAVTFPNTALTLSGSQTVTWNVAGTSGGPVNTPSVDILLSTDGGFTYPITLASGVPNNGSADIVLPNLDTDSARIKVRGSGNVFFDISNTDFTVEPASGLTITPVDPLEVSGVQGGSFAPACRTYTLENTGATALAWQAGADAAWVGLSPSTGNLGDGESINVDLCIESAADALAPGIYTAAVTFTNLQNAAMHPRTAVLSVLPAGGILQFAVAGTTSGEDDRAAVVTVNRVGEPTGVVGVTYAAGAGSASPGTDYILPNGILSWGNGDHAPKSFTIDIIDNQVLEPTEFVLLQLSNPSGGAQLGNLATFTLTILDNDLNDSCGQPRGMAGSPFTATQSTDVATSTGDPTPSCAMNAGNGVWYQFTAPAFGTLFIDTDGSGYDTVIAAFTGDCGSLTEIDCDDDGGPFLTSSLVLAVVPGTSYRFLAGGYNSAVGELVFNARFIAGPPGGIDNDWCANAVPVSTTPFQSRQTTLSATSSGDPVPTCAGNPSNGVWYRYTPPRDGFLKVDLAGSDFDTVIGMYGGPCGSLSLLDCNDDESGLMNTSVTETFLPSGTTAYVLCGGYNGAQGNLTATFTFEGCVEGIADGNFEVSAPWPAWLQSSEFFPTPLDDAIIGSSSGPLSGSSWVYFYGPNDSQSAEMATLGQIVFLPLGTEVALRFQLWIGRVGLPYTDTLKVQVDGATAQTFNEPMFSTLYYSPVEVNLSAFADGSSHLIELRFDSPVLGGRSDWNVDDVQLKICRPDFDQDGFPDDEDLDDDNDRIPDDWENANGLNAMDPSDAVLDLDGDQASGFEEYIADTSPTNTQSVLRLRIDPRPPGSDEQPLSFDSSLFREYFIELLPDLTSSAWLPGPTNIPGNGGVSTLVITNPAPVLHFRLGAELP